MQFEKKIKNIGGSLFMLIPADLCRYMDIKAEDTIVIQDDLGKKGKFLSAWKKTKKK